MLSMFCAAGALFPGAMFSMAVFSVLVLFLSENEVEAQIPKTRRHDGGLLISDITVEESPGKGTPELLYICLLHLFQICFGAPRLELRFCSALFWFSVEIYLVSGAVLRQSLWQSLVSLFFLSLNLVYDICTFDNTVVKVE